MKPTIVKTAERVARSCFLGIAIPHQPKLSKDTFGPIKSEKILKFSRKALIHGIASKRMAVDPRIIGSQDNMRFKVGKPGSKDRVEALVSQYASLAENETSPFCEE